MWVDSGINYWHTLMGKDVLDRPEGQHDEPEGRIRGVEAVGAVDDETHPAVEPFVLCVVDAETDRCQDARSPFADRLGDGDEGLEPASRCLGTESVEELADLALGKVTGEHGTKRLLQRVGTPEVASSALQPSERHGLVVGEIGRVLQQRPARSFEASCRIFVRELAEVLPDLSTDLVEGGGDEVRSDRGAVPASQQVRFPSPSPEPVMRNSA